MRSSRVPLPGSTPILLARSPTDSLALALTCLSLSCLSVTRLLACVTKLNMHAANREALRQPLAHSLTHSLSLSPFSPSHLSQLELPLGHQVAGVRDEAEHGRGKQEGGARLGHCTEGADGWMGELGIGGGPLDAPICRVGVR